jgi:hypothetical protein
MFPAPSARRGLAQRFAAFEWTDVRFVFAVLVVLAAVPVLVVKVAPLSDYVNHLARMHVIAEGDRDGYLSAFYRIDWKLIPNLAMDLVVPPLAQFMNVYRAGQVFMVAILFLLASGPIAIHYALYRRFNLFPLTAFLFLYNRVFLVGLTNYLAGAGLAMWSLAAYILLRDRSLWLRIAVSAVCCLALYVCHLSALGLYGIAIGSFELWAFAKRRFVVDRRLLETAAALVLPVLPIVPLLVGSATWGLADEYEWSGAGKIDGLLMIFRAYDDVFDLGILALVGCAFAWGVRTRLIGFHPAALVLAAIGVLAFLAMPAIMFGSYMADQRLPIAIFLMLLGFGRLRYASDAERNAFVVLVVAFSLIRYAEVSLHWEALSSAYKEYAQAVRKIDRGAKMIVAYADEPVLNDQSREALSHAACLAMIERSALVSTAFTVPGKQIMRVREPFRGRVDTEDGTPPSVSRLIASTLPGFANDGSYWDDWQTKHDFVTVLYTERGAANPDPDLLSLVHDGDGFQIYKIRRAGRVS